MKNMIRLNFFIMRKKASTYVIPFILFAFGILTAYLDGINADAYEAEAVGIAQIFSSCSGIAMLLCAIATVLFLGTDLKDGAIKNIAGTVRNKMDYVLPKTLLLSVYHVIVLLSLAAGSMIGSALFLKNVAEFEAVPFIRYFGILCLLMIGFTMVMTFLVYLMRSTSGPIALAIFLGTGLYYNLVYGLLGSLLRNAGIEFDFSKISVTMQIGLITPAASGDEMVTACTIGVCYILIFGLLTKYAITKKDIA